jgi:hypothetical protein
MSMHYFPYSGGTGMDPTNSASGHVTPKLCVLHPVGSLGQLEHSGVCRARNVDALFFTLRWDCY